VNLQTTPSQFQLKYDTARALGDLLREWGIPFTGCINERYHYALRVQRFHVWAYWRPMTVSRYERMTLDYRGPYLPIFASRTEYSDDEQYVYEGYDFNMKRNHHYRTVPFYFVLPDFLLNPPLPHERSWSWHPAIRVTKALARKIINTEDRSGGWKRNRRGHLQIPKCAGYSGKEYEVKNGDGWARFNGENALLTSVGEFE